MLLSNSFISRIEWCIKVSSRTAKGYIGNGLVDRLDGGLGCIVVEEDNAHADRAQQHKEPEGGHLKGSRWARAHG